MLNIFKGLVSDLELVAAEVQDDHVERISAPSGQLRRRGKRSRPKPKTALIAQATSEKAAENVHRGTFVKAGDLVDG
jgi:hypothetical protein